MFIQLLLLLTEAISEERGLGHDLELGALGVEVGVGCLSLQPLRGGMLSWPQAAGSVESLSHGDPWWRRGLRAAPSGAAHINAACCCGGTGKRVHDSGSVLRSAALAAPRPAESAGTVPSACGSLSFLECHLQEASHDHPQPQGPRSGLCVPHHTQDHPGRNHLVARLSSPQSCEPRGEHGTKRLC